MPGPPAGLQCRIAQGFNGQKGQKKREVKQMLIGELGILGVLLGLVSNLLAAVLGLV